MKKKIKATLFLALLVSSLTYSPVNGMFFTEDDELRLFLDYWGFIKDENGEWTIGRITHCDNPGKNCIIGPTVIGTC